MAEQLLLPLYAPPEAVTALAPGEARRPGAGTFVPSALPGCPLLLIQSVSRRPPLAVQGLYLYSPQQLPSRGGCYHYLSHSKARLL